MLNKKTRSAPLPFQGQKRYLLNSFESFLKELKPNQINTVVDLFGGSGLLSHTAKRILPDSKVIYNDYDNYTNRLINVGSTNALLEDIRYILKDVAIKNKISDVLKQRIVEVVCRYEKSGFVDYVTLSSNILFSGNYITNLEQLKAETFYNRLKQSSYNFKATEYLHGLEVVNFDYLELFHQYKDVQGVLFVVDPPYLTTDTKTYLSNQYWRLSDFLDILNILDKSNFVFFTSNKSNLIELCEWLKMNRNINNPFEDAELKTHQTQLNPTSKYIDMMFTRIIEMQKAS